MPIRWTAKDGSGPSALDRAAALHAAGLTYAEIAVRLATTAKAVQRAFQRHGLAHARPGPAVMTALRRLHLHGYNDPQIAARVGCSATTVWNHRRKLGLPPNGFGAPARRVVRRKLALWLAAEGCRSLAEFRHRLARVRVLLAGWPAGATPAQGAVLAALRDGPRTLPELATALGSRLTPRPTNRAPRPECLEKTVRTLRRLGWVLRARRGRLAVWSLAPGVLTGRLRAEAKAAPLESAGVTFDRPGTPAHPWPEPPSPPDNSASSRNTSKT